MKDVFFEALTVELEKKAFSLSMLTPLGSPAAGISRIKSLASKLTGKTSSANPVQYVGQKTIVPAVRSFTGL